MCVFFPLPFHHFLKDGGKNERMVLHLWDGVQNFETTPEGLDVVKVDPKKMTCGTASYSHHRSRGCGLDSSKCAESNESTETMRNRFQMRWMRRSGQRSLFEASAARDPPLRDACWVWHFRVWSCWKHPCDQTSGGHLRTMTMDSERPKKVGKPGVDSLAL